MEAAVAAKEIAVKKYVVKLSDEERVRLYDLISKGKKPSEATAEGADFVEGRRV
jgi:hypothetical protein